MNPIPAGLIDHNCEIFATETIGKCKATYEGKVIEFSELPEEILQSIEDEALSDKRALQSFKEDGITDIRQLTEHWAWCNLGRYDSIPDYQANKGTVQKEYFDCGRRGRCMHEFRRCSKIKVGDSFLTGRETDCVKFIGQGLSDKEIAERMGLADISVASLTQRVREKLSFKCRSEVAAYAVKMGIV